MPGCQWGDVATWFGSVGTTAAVVYALFNDHIVTWWRRPKLSVRADHSLFSDCQATWFGVQKEVPGVFLRLWVQNDGRTRAQNVEVIASGLRRLVEGQFVKDVRFLPMNLVWTHTHEPSRHWIAPGVGRHCDLASVADPGAWDRVWLRPTSVPKPLPWLHLKLEQEAHVETHILGPGTYELDLCVVSDNTDLVAATIELKLEPVWSDHDTMLKDGSITLRHLPRRP